MESGTSRPKLTRTLSSSTFSKVRLQKADKGDLRLKKLEIKYNKVKTKNEEILASMKKQYLRK